MTKRTQIFIIASVLVGILASLSVSQYAFLDERGQARTLVALSKILEADDLQDSLVIQNIPQKTTTTISLTAPTFESLEKFLDSTSLKNDLISLQNSFKTLYKELSSKELLSIEMTFYTDNDQNEKGTISISLSEDLTDVLKFFIRSDLLSSPNETVIIELVSLKDGRVFTRIPPYLKDPTAKYLPKEKREDFLADDSVWILESIVDDSTFAQYFNNDGTLFDLLVELIPYTLDEHNLTISRERLLESAIPDSIKDAGLLDYHIIDNSISTDLLDLSIEIYDTINDNAKEGLAESAGHDTFLEYLKDASQSVTIPTAIYFDEQDRIIKSTLFLDLYTERLLNIVSETTLTEETKIAAPTNYIEI